MIDYSIMAGIVLLLLSLVTLGAKYISTGNNSFFDQQNTKSMRGFWCLVVILVHIPQAYQNPIQDLIGSFAYIGVTFFFMTSAYGLSLGAQVKPNSLVNFWIKRLPKILIPTWVANIIFALIFFVIWKQETSLISCFEINGWVKWLLACYVSFWFGYIVNRKNKYSMAIVIILVTILSGSIYYLKHIEMINTTTWCPESFGFIWGMLLFSQYDKIKRFFYQKWFASALFFCLSSLALGIMYLLFKSRIFWGDYILKIILGLSILCFIIILNSKITIGNKISWFLGDISFEVYLVHGMVFSLLQRLLPNGGSALFIVLAIMTSILAATLVHKISNILLRYFIPFLNKRLLR